MTKEEILKKKFEQQQMFSDTEHWSYKYVIEAMEEYAKALARQDESGRINAETEKLIEDISRDKEQWKFTANTLAGTNERLEKELSEAQAEIERLKAENKMLERNCTMAQDHAEDLLVKQIKSPSPDSVCKAIEALANKWVVAYDDKEQEFEFKAEFKNDVLTILQVINK